MIPYGRQDISQDDIDAVVEVLRSDFLTQGPLVPQFEQAMAQYVGAGHAVAANSATAALHLACLALGVAPGDRVWTSPISFVASANCARYCGAEVDFVDIDPRTYNLCPRALEAKLLVAEREGRLPKVVIPVHLCGKPCELQAIHALSVRFGFRIIEDASHAIGARYHGERIGNCRYSDITVFSFHPVKIITTAEGGMAMTNDAALAAGMALLRSHGITREPGKFSEPTHGDWYYEQLDLGYNYRMTDLQAALGLSQLQRIEAFLARRRELALRYQQALVELPLQLPLSDLDSAWHLYVIRLLKAERRREVFEALRRAGIGVNVHYIPIYRQPWHRRPDLTPCAEAERYYAGAISLPLHARLTDQEHHYVCATLAGLLGGASSP